MGGCENLNPKTGEWLRNIQTPEGVGGCETLNPKRSEWHNIHTLEGVVRAKPQTLKVVSRWVPNPEP